MTPLVADYGFDQPLHGVYLPVLPNVLDGIVEAPEGQLAVAGSFFLPNSRGLTGTLLSIQAREDIGYHDLSIEDLFPPTVGEYIPPMVMPGTNGANGHNGATAPAVAAAVAPRQTVPSPAS